MLRSLLPLLLEVDVLLEHALRQELKHLPDI